MSQIFPSFARSYMQCVCVFFLLGGTVCLYIEFKLPSLSFALHHDEVSCIVRCGEQANVFFLFFTPNVQPQVQGKSREVGGKCEIPCIASQATNRGLQGKRRNPSGKAKLLNDVQCFSSTLAQRGSGRKSGK